MTTLVVTAESSDQSIKSQSATYSTARAGSSLGLQGTDNAPVGQEDVGGQKFIYEGFLNFDTSELPDDAFIISVTLEIQGIEDESDTDFIIEARARDWGDTLTTADWVAGDSLDGLTLLATFATSGGWDLNSYNEFTSESAFVSAVNKTGFTRIILCSSRTSTDPGTSPASNTDEWVGWWTSEQAGQEPKLTIEYHIPVVHELEALLQGVGTFEGTISQDHALGAILQGVGTVAARLFRTPPGGGAEWTDPELDFTVYDAYLEANAEVTGLLFYEDESAKPATVNKELRPVRQDTGNNPFEVRPESGDIFSQGDFSHGIEQLYYHREGRDDKRYFWSEGFDISEPGVLKHLHATTSVNFAGAGSETSASQLCQFNGEVYVSDGETVWRSSDLSSWTEEDPGGASNVTITQLVSSGQHLYAACGADGIYRRTAAGSWSQFSTVAATRLGWLKSRLIAADGDQLFELITGSESALVTLPTGWLFTSLFEAGPYVYATAAAEADGQSEIRHFGLDDSDAITPLGQTPMPRGQLAVGGRGYLNTAYIGVGKITTGGGYDPVIYQGVPDQEGFLQLIKLAEGEGSASDDLSVLAFEPIGEAVLVGWSLATGSPFGARSGLAFHDIRKDAFYAHLNSGLATGDRILSILSFKGKTLFTVESQGLYLEDTDNYVAEAMLWSSLGDWSTAGPKVWDQLSIAHAGLTSGMSVELHYTLQLPKDDEYSEALVSDVAGSTGGSISLGNQESRIFGVKIVSNALSDQSDAPEITSFSVRSNPTLDVPEWTVTRYIRLVGVDQRDNRGEIRYQDPDAIRALIQGLIFSWVRLYEPGVTWTARVKQVADVKPMLPTYDETSGEALKEVYLIEMQLEGTRG